MLGQHHITFCLYKNDFTLAGPGEGACTEHIKMKGCVFNINTQFEIIMIEKLKNVVLILKILYRPIANQVVNYFVINENRYKNLFFCKIEFPVCYTISQNVVPIRVLIN